MSLEYSDDNELIYQAKAAAKDIVNAKYEVTKKVGNFLFIAHSEEEFYQRATAIDEILESTSSRRLASVSDSKAKLVKALYQEWDIKHANCTLCPKVADKEVSVKDEQDKEQAISDASDVQKKSNPYSGLSDLSSASFPQKEYAKEASAKGSSERNFNLPERVASPVLPEDKKSRKLWDKWSITRQKDGDGEPERRFPLEENSPKTGKPYTPFEQTSIKLGLLDKAIGGSLGRLDDPEVKKQLTPNSAVWIDAHGLYGPDKKRLGNSLKGRKGEDAPGAIDPSHIRAMAGTVLGRSSLGNSGVFESHHRCTGNTFRGFDSSDNSFTQCQHEHHEGDGCGLTSDVAEDGSMQPGCGQHHILTKVQTPSFVSVNGQVGALPHMEDERPKDLSGLTPDARQQHINRSKSSAGSEADSFTNPTEEQVGEIPPSRMFLMHPDQSARWAAAKDAYHARTGGTGPHPDNQESFKIGDKTHRVGDIVSTTRSWGASEPRTEANLGILAGVSSHRNGKHVLLGRSEGLAPDTEGDSSMAGSTPGEYSLIVHRLDSPTTGKSRYPRTAVDPDTNQISPNSVNETTQYYPSSNVDTVQTASKKVNTLSKLYSTLKGAQASFKARSETPRPTEKPKTVKPSRDNLDMSTLDLGDLFGDSNE